MKIACDKKSQDSEIEISGTSLELFALGKKIIEINTDLKIISAGFGDQYYPIIIESLLLKIINDTSSLICIEIKDDQLVMSGNTLAMKRLGQSILNVFCGTPSERHLHLEYCEGDLLLAPTEYTVTFVCIN